MVFTKWGTHELLMTCTLRKRLVSIDWKANATIGCMNSAVWGYIHEQHLATFCKWHDLCSKDCSMQEGAEDIFIHIAKLHVVENAQFTILLHHSARHVVVSQAVQQDLVCCKTYTMTAIAMLLMDAHLMSSARQSEQSISSIHAL